MVCTHMLKGIVLVCRHLTCEGLKQDLISIQLGHRLCTNSVEKRMSKITEVTGRVVPEREYICIKAVQ